MTGYLGTTSPRVACPYCGRDTAYSPDPNRRHLWLRRHNNPKTHQQCGARRIPVPGTTGA